MTIVYPPPGKWQEAVQLALTEKYRGTDLVARPDPTVAPARMAHAEGLRPHLAADRRRRQRGLAAGAPAQARGDAALGPARPRPRLRHDRDQRPGDVVEPGGHLHPSRLDRAGGADGAGRDPRSRDARRCSRTARWGRSPCATAATFLGYWRNPEATAKALDAERWYHTGDFGHVRDGFVYLEGRRQDLIIRGGENIYPVEIENRLIEHPGLFEVAVVGVPHPALGPGGQGIRGREGPRVAQRSRRRGVVRGDVGRGSRCRPMSSSWPSCPTTRRARFSSTFSAPPRPRAISYRSEPHGLR